MKHKPLLAFALFAAILLSVSCKTSLRYASVHIAEVLPPVGAQTLYIAVSPNFWIKDSFLTSAVVLPPGSSYTDITIDDIAWDTDDKNESGETRDFWLLAAEDLAEDGKFGPGDRYVPFAHITLTNGETLEIKTLDMTNPIPYNLDSQQHIISILHSNPELVDKYRKIFLNIDGTFCPFSDPLLCKEFIFWNNGFGNAYFFWDKNGDDTLNTGDYNITTLTGSFPSNASYILSPLMTF